MVHNSIFLSARSNVKQRPHWRCWGPCHGIRCWRLAAGGAAAAADQDRRAREARQPTGTTVGFVDAASATSEQERKQDKGGKGKQDKGGQGKQQQAKGQGKQEKAEGKAGGLHEKAEGKAGGLDPLSQLSKQYDKIEQDLAALEKATSALEQARGGKKQTAGTGLDAWTISSKYAQDSLATPSDTTNLKPALESLGQELSNGVHCISVSQILIEKDKGWMGQTAWGVFVDPVLAQRPNLQDGAMESY
eukprot:g70253.t1